MMSSIPIGLDAKISSKHGRTNGCHASTQAGMLNTDDTPATLTLWQS
jgi:hypothetical protein